MKKGVRKSQIVMNLSMSKYPVIREICKEMNIVVDEEKESENFSIWWMDGTCSVERVLKLKWYHYINHFVGMTKICRKVSLTRNMRKMRKEFPKSYRFYPQSWTLPNMFHQFEMNKRINGKSFIVKPNTGCQGKGIIITKEKREVEKYGDCVVQIYVDNPYLIDGYKFDLRVYVLVKSVEPLSVFFYNEGLVRMCTAKWKEPTVRNLKNSFMHLTNYAINKKNKDFIQSKGDGSNSGEASKKNFAFLNEYIKDDLRGRGYDDDACDRSVEKLWRRVKNICLKSIVSILPALQESYKSCMSNSKFKMKNKSSSICFEILGYDIMLDHKLNPWLLEVNHSPSFGTDSDLDHDIKYHLIKESMLMLGINPFEKVKKMRIEKQVARERIYKSSKKDSTSPKKEIVLEERTTEEIRDYHRSIEDKYMKRFERIYPIIIDKDLIKDDEWRSKKENRLKLDRKRKFDKFIRRAFSLYEKERRVGSVYSEYRMTMSSRGSSEKLPRDLEREKRKEKEREMFRSANQKVKRFATPNVYLKKRYKIKQNTFKMHKELMVKKKSRKDKKMKKLGKKKAVKKETPRKKGKTRRARKGVSSRLYPYKKYKNLSISDLVNESNELVNRFNSIMKEKESHPVNIASIKFDSDIEQARNGGYRPRPVLSRERLRISGNRSSISKRERPKLNTRKMRGKIVRPRPLTTMPKNKRDSIVLKGKNFRYESLDYVNPQANRKKAMRLRRKRLNDRSKSASIRNTYGVQRSSKASNDFDNAKVKRKRVISRKKRRQYNNRDKSSSYNFSSFMTDPIV